jgi:hypothetical protein
MANKMSKSKSAVRAAREAVQAAQREVLERAARNAEDLAVFFSSRERLAAVDEWLEVKTAGLKEVAEGKRAEHRRTAGLAVIALRDRGESLRDIARLTRVSEHALREMIRLAESGAANTSVDDQDSRGGADHDTVIAGGGADAPVGAPATPMMPSVGAP